MIRFTVIWRDELIDELATYWGDSTERDEISATVDRIDPELSNDAHLKGDDLGEGARRLSIGPLWVYFRVDVDDRKVFVEAIRISKNR
jgi:hypothetical protein